MLQFRALSTSDQDKLWHWLHIALWDPPPAGLRPLEVLQVPGVRIYAEDWGRPSDVGVVAQVNGTDAGACWVRLLPMGVGLASVDAETPQLGIALEAAFQHKGYGRLLMSETLRAAAQAGYKQVSLTVHPENPAQYMYESCGFRKVERRNTYHLMVASVPNPSLHATMAEDLGFTYRQRKGGVVEVLHHGRLASTLRGTDALDFVSEVQSSSSAQAQQLMARLTGNYKRGNERLAGEHPRNRR